MRRRARRTTGASRCEFVAEGVVDDVDESFVLEAFFEDGAADVSCALLDEVVDSEGVAVVVGVCEESREQSACGRSVALVSFGSAEGDLPDEVYARLFRGVDEDFEDGEIDGEGVVRLGVFFCGVEMFRETDADGLVSCLVVGARGHRGDIARAGVESQRETEKKEATSGIAGD